MKMPGDIIMLQEVAAAKATISKWQRDMREAGWDLLANPGKTKIRGNGVGSMVRSPIIQVPIRANTEEFRKRREKGRCEVIAVEIGGNMLRLANVYGQTGGHQDEEASMVTDHIIGSIMEELETQPGTPTIII